MQIALYSRIFNGDKDLAKIPYVEKILLYLGKHRIGIWMHCQLYDFLKGQPSSLIALVGVRRFISYQDFLVSDKPDCLLSLGGDGTLLDTVTLVQNSGIPILGINLGRLGFLASINKADIAEALDAITDTYNKDKTYTLDTRSLITLETNIPLFIKENYALNEIAIEKTDTTSMIAIHAYLNGKLLNVYWADGLIVATPTGSTAYSLSCGGPILLPETDNFIITPICPHNLSVRPIVVPGNSKLTLSVEARSKEFLVSLDARKVVCQNQMNLELCVKKASFLINLIRLKKEDYTETLRDKLMWGRDVRN